MNKCCLELKKKEMENLMLHSRRKSIFDASVTAIVLTFIYNFFSHCKHRGCIDVLRPEINN